MKLKRKLEVRDVVTFAAILLFIGLVVWVGLTYKKIYGSIDAGSMAETAKNLQAMILELGRGGRTFMGYSVVGLVVMTGLGALHIVISFIPAAIVQFAGGLIYGIPIGMATGIIGAMVGTAISFTIGRLLGRRVLTLLCSEKTIEKIDSLISSDLSAVVLLALYIIPTPKDFFAYFLGPTKMKAGKLFLISAVGRLPGMLVATYLGDQVVRNDNITSLIIVLAFLLALAIVFLVFRKRIFAFLSRKRTEADAKTIDN